MTADPGAGGGRAGRGALRYPESPVFYRDLRRRYRRAARAEGVWVEAEDGERFLDACGGALAVSVGHGRPEVARAAARQLEAAAFVHGSQFTTAAMEEAAERLLGSLPPAYREAKVFLTPGGAEAVETALKLARAHALAVGQPQRRRVVAQTPGYHGSTLGALAVSGREALRAPYAPLLPPAEFVPAPWCPRCPLGLEHPGCEVACAGEAGTALARLGGEALALLVEPILGASAGGFAPPEDYLRRLRRLADERGLLLVADEVLTGCGRTGRFLASEHAGVEADLLVLGKGLTSGYLPGGAVVAKAEVVAAVAPDFPHGFTFSHHPVVAAVVAEVLRLIREEGLVERAARLESDLAAALEPLLDSDRGTRPVAGVSVRGLLAGLRLLPPAAGGVTGARFAAAARRERLLVYPTAGPATPDPRQRADAVLLAPPLTVHPEEIAEIGRRLRRTVSSLRTGEPRTADR